MEFKRLSDVEVVAEPAESANVLIEENGVIKKAPKTAVGGGGNTEWDARIFYDSRTGELFFIEGGYNSIHAKIENKEAPRVSLFARLAPSGDCYEICAAVGAFMWNTEFGEEIALPFHGGSFSLTIRLLSDDSMNIDW